MISHTPKNKDDLHYTFTGNQRSGKTYAMHQYIEEWKNKNIIDVEPVAINDKRLLKDENK